MLFTVQTSANWPLSCPVGRDGIRTGDRYPALAIVASATGVDLVTRDRAGFAALVPIALFASFGQFDEILPQELPVGWVFRVGPSLFQRHTDIDVTFFVGYPEILSDTDLWAGLFRGEQLATPVFSSLADRIVAEL